MRNNLTYALLVAGALLISSCGSETPNSVPSGEQNQPSNQLVSLTVEVPFSAKVGMEAQGAPSTASQAIISLYDGTTLLGTKKLVKAADGTTLSTVFQVKPGKTYRIEASIQDNSAPSVEVAWGKVEYAATGDGRVAVPFKGILKSASFRFNKVTPGGKEYLLEVAGPNGEVPLNDFDVTYAAAGGQITTQSKLGFVAVAPADTTNTVTATITGLGADHQAKTITASVRPQQGVFKVTGKAAFIRGNTYDKQMTVAGQTESGKKVTGTVSPTGEYEIIFPDVSDSYAPITKYSTSPLDGTPNPDSAHVVKLSRMAILDAKGNSIGKFVFDRGLPSTQELSEWIFTDQNVTQGRNSLVMGWNIINPSYGSSPLVGGGQLALFIYALKIDASVSQTADTTTPLIGNEVSHQIKASLPSGNGQFLMSAPKGLQVKGGASGISGATCSEKSASDDEITYSCMFSNQATVIFKTVAQSISLYPKNPSTLTVSLIENGYIDTDSTNDMSTLTFTRVDNSAVGNQITPLIDLQAPLITIDPLQSVIVGSPINLSGNVSDNYGVASVEVYDGVGLLGRASLVGAPVNKWNYQWNPTQTGASTLTVVATDLAGNTTKKKLDYTW